MYHAIISSIIRKFNSFLTYLCRLQDNVRCMVRKFLEFTINNYKNCTEPISILQDFQLSLVRIFSWFFFYFVLFFIRFSPIFAWANNFFLWVFQKIAILIFFPLFICDCWYSKVRWLQLWSCFLDCFHFSWYVRVVLWTDFASFCFSWVGTWFEWLPPSHPESH